MASFKATISPKSIKALILILLVSLLTLPLLLTTLPQDDTWRHLELGRLFVDKLKFPALQPYGFLVSEQKFIDYSWMSCVVFYLIFRALNDFGLIIISSAITAVCISYTSFSLNDKNKSTLIERYFYAIPVIVLCALSIKWRVTARPEVFSFIFFTIFINQIFKLVQKDYISIPSTVMVVILWNNFHASSVMALALAGCVVLGSLFSDRTIKKNSIKFLLIVVASLFINPWGYRYVWSSIEQSILPINQYIFEYKSLSYGEWWPLRAPLLMIGGISLFFSPYISRVKDNRKSRQICLQLVFIFLIILSLKYSRAYPYFVFISLPVLIKFSSALFIKLRDRIGSNKLIYTFTVIVYISGLSVSINDEYGYGYKFKDTVIMRGVNYLNNSPVRGKILNDFISGGYIMWTSKDRFPLFIDNRSPLYAENSFPEYLSLGSIEKCKEIINKYEFDAVLLTTPEYCPVYDVSDKYTCSRMRSCYDAKNWALIYWEEGVIVLVRRRDKYREYIHEHEYKVIDPTLLSVPAVITYLDKLKIDKNNVILYEAELKKAIALRPLDSRALYLMATYEYWIGKRSLEELSNTIKGISR